MLDFRIIEKIIYSDESISLGVNDHNDIITVAKKLDLPLLQRAAEYYENITYTTSELDDLIKEIDAVIKHGIPENSTKKILENFIIVINKAREMNRPIEALSD